MDIKILKNSKEYATFVFEDIETATSMFPSPEYELVILRHNYTTVEIDAMVVEKIREKYDVNEEAKMLRLGINDSTNEAFVSYNNYVEECRLWGRELKAIGDTYE